MTSSDRQNPNSPAQKLPSSSNSRVSGEIGSTSGYSGGQKPHFPNPPDATNPDPVTLRDQWRYAIRQYSKWYSHAWGTAILAGVSFFALGWIIKGSNPLPSFKHQEEKRNPPSPDRDGAHQSS